MTRNHFADSCIAITFGVGAGMLLSVFGQKALNQHYKNTCHERPEHNLIYIRGFLGDSYYCVKGAEYKAN